MGFKEADFTEQARDAIASSQNLLREDGGPVRSHDAAWTGLLASGLM